MANVENYERDKTNADELLASIADFENRDLNSTDEFSNDEDQEAADLLKDWWSQALPSAKKKLEITQREQVSESSFTSFYGPAEQPALSPLEASLRSVQNLIVRRINAGGLSLTDKEIADFQKEVNGENNDGRPIYGPITQKLLKTYHSKVQEEMASLMSEMASMHLDFMPDAPIPLKVENREGVEAPEHPNTYQARMRLGKLDWAPERTEARTGNSNPPYFSKMPSADILNKLSSTELFLQRAQNRVFNEKLLQQEKILAERIVADGWPRAWLDLPQRQQDRSAWCSAVIRRMDESSNIARTVEAIYHLRQKFGLSGFGKDALEALPEHITVKTKVGSEGALQVESVTSKHPADLELNDPKWLAKEGNAEKQWLQKFGTEISNVLRAKEFQVKDPSRNSFFQGDMAVQGLTALVDKQTNEVVGTVSTDDWNTANGKAKILEQFPKRQIEGQSCDVIHCRMTAEVGKTANGETAEIVVGYDMQYAKSQEVINYHKLITTPIGKSSKPQIDEWPSGKLHLKPNDYVIITTANREEKILKAKDLPAFIGFERLKQNLDLGVSVVMDASMLASGAGSILKGAQILRSAQTSMNALRQVPGGMNLIRSQKLGAHVLENVGNRTVMRGAWEMGLGITAGVNDDTLQDLRHKYFLTQATLGVPGISHAVGGTARMLGIGAEAATVARVHQMTRFYPGRVTSALEANAGLGFKWTGRFMLADTLYNHAPAIWRSLTGTKRDGVLDAVDVLSDLKTPATGETSDRRKQGAFLANVEEMIERWEKDQNLKDDESQKLLTRAKSLIGLPPKDLDEKQLLEFNKKRESDIQAFLKELKPLLAVDGTYVAACEKKNADEFASRLKEAQKNGVSPTKVAELFTAFVKSTNNGLLVSECELQRDRYKQAQVPLPEQEKALAAASKKLYQLEEKLRLAEAAKDEPNQKEAKQKREALEKEVAESKERLSELQAELTKLYMQADKAEQSMGEALRKSDDDLRELTKTDPLKRFAGLAEQRKAAALAYLLLSARVNGGLPSTAILDKQETVIPAWSAAPLPGIEGTLSRSKREVTQTLRTSDVSDLLTGDLLPTDGSDKRPASTRLHAAQLFDTLGVISLEQHCATLREVLRDKDASLADKKAAVATITQLVARSKENENFRKTQPDQKQFASAGAHLHSTPEALCKTLTDIATDKRQDQDLRAWASFCSAYVLQKLMPDSLDDSEKDSINRLMAPKAGEVVGLNYKQYLSELLPKAGLPHEGRPGIVPKNDDEAGWNRRFKSLQALEHYVDRESGKTPFDIDRKTLIEKLAECVDESRAEVSIAALKTLTDIVELPDGTRASRLSLLDSRNPELALKVRQQALAILQRPGYADSNIVTDCEIRLAAMELLPKLLNTTSNLKNAQNEEAIMRLEADAVRTLQSSLYATNAKHIIELCQKDSASTTQTPDQKNQANKELKARIAEFSVINGYSRSLEISQAYKLALQQEIKALKQNEIRQTGESAEMKALTTQLGKLGPQAVPSPTIKDLTNLSALSYAQEDLRARAIKALGELKSPAPETIRIIAERANPPARDNDEDPKVEPSADVRLASLKALQHLIPHADFSQLAATLVDKERNPAVANILRNNAKYTEIAIHPSSPQYKNRIAEATKTLATAKNFQTADAIFNNLILKKGDQESAYGWLTGSTLGTKLLAHKESVYPGVSGYIAGSFARTWPEQGLNLLPGAPGKLVDMAAVREGTEIKKVVDDYLDRFKKLTATAEGFNEQGQRVPVAAQDEAIRVCYAIACGKLSGEFHYNAAVRKAGYSRTEVPLNESFHLGLRLTAARALCKTCVPGAPDLDTKIKYLVNAFETVDHPKVRNELLKGVADLCAEPKGGNDENIIRTIQPLASKKVLLALQNSLDNASTFYLKDNLDLQSNCVDFLRKHCSLTDLPELDAVIENAKTPSPVRQAILELISEKRGSMLKVWNAAPESSTGLSLDDRVDLLRQTVAESQRAHSPTETEIFSPAAVWKISSACKNQPLTPSDPRIPLLKELLHSTKLDQRGSLAAAHALLQGDAGTSTQADAVRAIVDVAVNGTRFGTRRDAAQLLNQLPPQLLPTALEKLRECQRTEHQSQLREAQKLSLTGQILLLQGKTDEAATKLKAAANTFRGKHEQLDLTQDFKEFERFTDVDHREYLQDMLKTLELVGKIDDSQGKGDHIVATKTNQLRGTALSSTHPSSIAAEIREGDWLASAGKNPNLSATTYSNINNAIIHYRRALLSLPKEPSSRGDQIVVLDKLARSSGDLSALDDATDFGGLRKKTRVALLHDSVRYEEAALRLIKVSNLPGTEQQIPGRHLSIAEKYLSIADMHGQKDTSSIERRTCITSAVAQSNAAINAARAQKIEHPVEAAQSLRKAAALFGLDAKLLKEANDIAPLENALLEQLSKLLSASPSVEQISRLLRKGLPGAFADNPRCLVNIVAQSVSESAKQKPEIVAHVSKVCCEFLQGHIQKLPEQDRIAFVKEILPGLVEQLHVAASEVGGLEQSRERAAIASDIKDSAGWLLRFGEASIVRNSNLTRSEQLTYLLPLLSTDESRHQEVASLAAAQISAKLAGQEKDNGTVTECFDGLTGSVFAKPEAQLAIAAAMLEQVELFSHRCAPTERLQFATTCLPQILNSSEVLLAGAQQAGNKDRERILASLKTLHAQSEKSLFDKHIKQPSPDSALSLTVCYLRQGKSQAAWAHLEQLSNDDRLSVIDRLVGSMNFSTNGLDQLTQVSLAKAIAQTANTTDLNQRRGEIQKLQNLCERLADQTVTHPQMSKPYGAQLTQLNKMYDACR